MIPGNTENVIRYRQLLRGMLPRAPLATLWRHRVLTALLLVGCVFVAQFVFLKLPEIQAAYTISNSARFNDDDSAKLTWTPSGGGSNATGTISFWMKKGNIDTALPTIFSTANMQVGFRDSGGSSVSNLHLTFDGASNRLVTNALFRDPAAWTHVVIAFGTQQATAANRVKIYIDGAQVTSFATGNYPAQAYDIDVFDATAHEIGNHVVTSRYYDGYLSDFYAVDGQQLSPTSFGEYDANGYWRPKSYTGTYGTNGFKLDFASGSDLGNDVSGNNNDWTVSAMDATDQVIDTPTNFFPTFNSIWKSSSATYSQGNLTTVSSGASIQITNFATMGVTTGKWYWEVSLDTQSNINSYLGIANSTHTPSVRTGYDAVSWAYIPSTAANCIAGSNSCKVTDSTVTTYSGSYASLAATYQAYGFAFDADSGKLFVRDSTGWLASSDPVAGTSPMFSGIPTTTPLFPTTTHDSVGSQNTQHTFIFGQSKNATSTATTLTYDSSAGGYFLYAPPTGFKALSTSNLPEPAVVVPKNYFDALAYTASSTVTLMHFDGTNGATTFTDSSASANSPHSYSIGGGSPTISTTQSKFGGASFKASATPDYITSVASGDYAFGTKDFTIDFWLYINSYSGSYQTVLGPWSISSNTGDWRFYFDPTAGNFNFDDYSAGTGGFVTARIATGLATGGWHHVAAVRSSTTVYVFLDGALADTETGDAANIGSTQALNIGAGYILANTGIDGYIDELRISKGIARWTSSFTAPAVPHSTDGPATRITSANFQPDLVWIKDRTSAFMHNIFDSVRGLVYPYLSSNATTKETGTASTTLTAFLSNGFTLGTSTLFNTSGNSYVSWLWKESSTSRMDVVTYRGTGSAQTIAHSLGVAPDFIIVKDRSGTNDWAVYHSSNTAAPATDYLLMNSTAATADDDTYWNDTAPTASVFSVKSNADVNTSGNEYVAYAFASTTGFSAFGSYLGNNSTDGPYVYTGFKPKYVMIKNTTTAGTPWVILDTARSTYNPVVSSLWAQATGAESPDAFPGKIDILTSGFKVRCDNSDCWINRAASSDVYVYAAFAEQPFQQSAQPYNLTIASSTRFISGNSGYLNRTPGSAGNRTTFTISFWMKQGNLATGDPFSAGTSNSDTGRIQLGFVSNQFQLDAFNWYVRTDAVYRDPASWQHVVISVDTTHATAADRIKIYVNNVYQSSAVFSYPSQSTALAWNDAVAHNIGRLAFNSAGYYDGYLSDFYNVDGQALTASSFGEYDTLGYWRPKTYSGTYGTNGFHLPLMGTSTAAGIGIDTSGNNNTWTVNNIATTDFVKDSPSNNFATLNSVDGASTLTSGNLVLNGGVNASNRGTFFIDPTDTTGYYFEATAKEIASTGMCIAGFNASAYNLTNDNFDCGGALGDAAYFLQRGAGDSNRWNYSTTTGGTCAADRGAGVLPVSATNDVLGLAIKNGKIWLAVNNTWVNSGNPAAGTGQVVTVANSVSPVAGGSNSSCKWSLNFGQGGTTTLTYRSDAGGYFYFDPPSGFKALSTANLPTPAVTVPKNYFDARLYTGTTTMQIIGGHSTTACGFGTYANGMCRGYLTSFAQFTVPGDWNNASNTIEVIGGGGGGSGISGGSAGAGGGGGAYSKSMNVSLTSGATIAYAVGAAGAAGSGAAGGNGGDTYFCNSTSNCASIAGTAVQVGAKGGTGGPTYNGGVGSGGATSTAVGFLRYKGGDGAQNQNGGFIGGSGGGAGGPNGSGGNAGSMITFAGSAAGGGGGGGNGGGSNGTAAPAGDPGAGAAGGNNSASSGGGTAGTSPGGAGGNGSAGGGGGGGGASRTVVGGVGGNGGDGTEWDSTHGSGGGGAAGGFSTGATMSVNGSAGLYGGGGVSAGVSSTGAANVATAGAQGIIVITYTPNPIQFTPSLVWLKDRTSANAHGLFDSLRAVYGALTSHGTNAEGYAASSTLTSFLSNGFMLGASSTVNTSGNNYISWLWKRCPTALFTASCTAGNGVDIITYTGNGSNRTISHNLGKAADFIIVKDRAGANDWAIYHSSNTAAPATDYLLMNSTAATADDDTYWNDTAPTASVFSLGTNVDVNTSGNTYVAYLFASTTGFSSFGTYTGNGSADGPFVYTGFKPKYVMYKRVNSTGSWRVLDTARQPNNPNDKSLFYESTSAETTETQADLLSNGFKLRGAGAGENGNGDTHIYIAFADVPFKYSAATAASSNTFVQAVAFLMGMVF